ncbi:NAD(P)/FAD-dependent oxidoreductase [Olivibacter sitiensis]|uniref:NAD(P)/FAD-dependent oxidoreductase n=1 Tax=Olivibacter sitiensis TaxID=376470 RepID=UPI00146FC0DF|nr:NAD(P)/FAD-dependent oxidoreductase [Olivibacter sitiensis]
MPHFSIPIVIIGSGPAGCTCSLQLSKQGIHHWLMDKESFPRDKVCGDGFGYRVMRTLKEIDGLFPQKFFPQTSHSPIAGIRIFAPNRKFLQFTFQEALDPLMPPGFTCTRRDFDNYLYQSTSSTYCSKKNPVTIVDILKRNEGYEITYREETDLLQHVRCQLLIAADGEQGISHKYIGSKTVKAPLIAARAYFKGVGGIDKRLIEVHFLKKSIPGYVWLFPLEDDRVNVGLILPRTLVKEKEIHVRQFLTRLLQEDPLFAERFAQARPISGTKGWSLASKFVPSSLCGDHYLLVGDRANLVDPITGEGIGNAVWSGYQAAKAANEALQKQDFRAAFLKQHYADIIGKQLSKEFAFSKKLGFLLRYPFILNIIASSAQKRGWLYRSLMKLFGYGKRG